MIAPVMFTVSADNRSQRPSHDDQSEPDRRQRDAEFSTSTGWTRRSRFPGRGGFLWVLSPVASMRTAAW